MKITKENVLKALRTENLSAGNFIEWRNGGYTDECAVGAVLRQYGALPGKISNLGQKITKGRFAASDNASTDELLRQGNYLGALSVEFERLSGSDLSGLTRPASREIRRKIVAWAREHLPDGTVYLDRTKI